MKPLTCSACPLFNKGQGFVRPSGTGANGILLLGEAPGRREAQLGEPFVGDAGAQLNRTLEVGPLKRGDFRVDNVIKCQPPNNWLEHAPWEEGAIASCDRYLEETVTRMKPKVIVAMGNTALRATLNMRGIEKKRGYVYDTALYDHFVRVIPTYHPSFVMRGMHNLTGVQLFDLEKADRIAKNGYMEPATQYLEHPNHHDIARFMEDARKSAERGGLLAVDIETPNSGGSEEDEYGDIVDADIIRISFSFEAGYAITIPFRNENIAEIAELLGLPFRFQVYWNADFDVPRLRSKALPIGRVLDAMWMWHFLQSDLPRGLGYVATFYTDVREWKSLSTEMPEYYSCKDADVTIQCCHGIMKTLEKEKRLGDFLRHGVELKGPLDEMGRSGVIIDPAQQAEFRKEVEEELLAVDAEVQGVVPVELKPRKTYKKTPSDVYLLKPHKEGYWDCDAEGNWFIVKPFLPGSSKQMLAYMKARKHPIARNHKTEKDTTDASSLEKLAKKYPDDPLYPLVLRSREFRKVKGQYIEGYVPDPDGRVRTIFTRKPSTWRFASERPNVQNVIKRGRLAKAYRRQFVAAPGHVLVELDYRAIEAVLVGYYAGDQDYVRAAKLGVHAILASHIQSRPISLTLPDEEIRRIVVDIKRGDPRMYAASKMVVHGSNYGGSARRLRIEYPEYFPSTGDAKRLQDIYFSTIARKVKRWQGETLSLAHSQHYLQNVFGYRHWFWDVLHWVGGGVMEWGTDAKRSLGFQPQSTAAGMMSEAILRIAQCREVFEMLRWTIHDALLAEIPDDKWLGDNIRYIKTCMENPFEQMGGLSIEVEVSIGKNWGEMEEWNEESCAAAVRG